MRIFNYVRLVRSDSATAISDTKTQDSGLNIFPNPSSGPVWLDQAYFANHENYHPLTGEGLNANYFSWSAAAILLMIREYGEGV